ncbi:MAG: histidinol phosphate phosphatase, partial [Gammaproteobacteria bacterium]|nr:histidinol phosphate phosphatase [Gammaproteobacteria bacterium]
CNGREVRTSGCRDLGRASVYTTTPESYDDNERRRFDRLGARAALRRFGGDCYSYGMLASGYCDVVVEVQLKPHDFLAAIPIVEGAGGRITDWRGSPLAPLDEAFEGRLVMAANEALWREAITELSD